MWVITEQYRGGDVAPGSVNVFGPFKTAQEAAAELDRVAQEDAILEPDIFGDQLGTYKVSMEVNDNGRVRELRRVTIQPASRLTD